MDREPVRVEELLDVALRHLPTARGRRRRAQHEHDRAVKAVRARGMRVAAALYGSHELERDLRATIDEVNAHVGTEWDRMMLARTRLRPVLAALDPILER